MNRREEMYSTTSELVNRFLRNWHSSGFVATEIRQITVRKFLVRQNHARSRQEKPTGCLSSQRHQINLVDNLNRQTIEGDRTPTKNTYENIGRRRRVALLKKSVGVSVSNDL